MHLVLLLVGMSLPTLNSLAGYSSMYVFGDSLSAVSGGGLQFPPPVGTSAANYWNGRFSNGQVWVEYLATRQGIPFDTNNDFSNFGDGSGQVYDNIIYGNYFPPADISTSLYIFWSGCSDCFWLAVDYQTNSWTVGISNDMANISNVVDVLYSQGVRTLVLPNSVDISKVPFFTAGAFNAVIAQTPEASDTNFVPSVIASIRAQVPQFNAALAVTIGQLRTVYPDLKLYAPDFYTQFDFVYNNPGIYGLTKTNIDVLEDPALTDKSFGGPGANYLFWDYLHPTTRVHADVANFVQQVISPLRFSQLVLLGRTNRFDLVNLPIGRTGALESNTNLLNPSGWNAITSVVVTGATQSVFIPTNGLNNACFFRLNFPP
ncbi:MAG: SGNH/GDSL hydrolase family protein [Verrucomicrobiota bacterium]